MNVVGCLLWLWLVLAPIKSDSSTRPTAFHSEVVDKEINYYSNHFIYLCLFIGLVSANISAILHLDYSSFALALYYLLNIAMMIPFATNLGTLLYGICTNTTPS